VEAVADGDLRHPEIDVHPFDLDQVIVDALVETAFLELMGPRAIPTPGPRVVNRWCPIHRVEFQG
jgi:hypothetical protein